MTVATAVRRQEMTAKIAVVGPPGSGVADFVTAASDTEVIRAETDLGLLVGRVAVGPELVLSLLAFPPLPRLRGLWDILETGALGMLVILDGRDPGRGRDLIGRAHRSGRPFGVFLNTFGGGVQAGDPRQTLGLDGDTVLIAGDGRDRRATRLALVSILDHLLG